MMEIVKVKDHDNEGGMTQADALAECKKRGLRMLTNLEVDAILQDDAQRKAYYSFFPCWTSTHLDYDGAACTITEGKKSVKCKMPERDGWYEADKFGLPFGKPSNSSNPAARYLWRISKYSGLVGRRGDWGGWNRRGVDAGWGSVVRLGVLAVKIGKPAKHKHVFRCECGKTRK